MPTVQVDKAHPVLVSLQSAKSDVVKNIGNVVLYYKAGPAGAAVSASEKDGELAEAATLTMEQGTWFIAKEATGTLLQEAPVSEEEGTTNIANGAVTAAKIATGAVTETKLGSEAVASTKIKKGGVPVPSASENAQEIGSAGGLRRVVVAYTGNNVETKVKIKHSLETRGTVAFGMKSAAKLPTEQPTTALGKWVEESVSEGTYTFTAAPGAKEEMFIIVIG